MTIYYVSTDGADTDNGTTTDTPWATLNQVSTNSYSAGDSILLHRGHTWRERLTFPSSGNSDNSITIGSYGTGDKPIIDGTTQVTGFTQDTDNIYVKTSFTPTADLVRQVFANNERLKFASDIAAMTQGSYYLDDAGDNLYVWATDDGDPDNHTIEYPSEYICLDLSGRSWIDVSELDLRKASVAGVGLRESSNANNITVDSCDISWVQRGIDCGGAAGIVGSQSNIIVQYCTIHDCLGEGIWLGGANNKAQFNTVYNSGKDKTQKGYTADGGGILLGVTADSCKAYGNHIYDTYYNAPFRVEYEDGYARPTGCEVKRNLIEHDLGSDGAIGPGIITEGIDTVCSHNIINVNVYTAAIYVHDNSSDESFYNNTIYVYGSASKPLALYILDAAGTTFKNNVIYSCDGSSVINISSDAISTFQSENNCFYHEGAAAGGFVWGSDTGYDTLALWSAASGTDSDSIQSDPLFADLSGDDFTLKSASPCINAGIEVGENLDYDSNPVPRGRAPDIGAYEMLYKKAGCKL